MRDGQGGRVSANLYCMGSMLVWAMAFPAVDLLLPVLSPLPLTAARMCLATAVLVPVWLLLEGAATLRRAAWGRGIVVGGLGFGLGACLLVMAQARTDAVTVAVISASMPVAGIALECLMDGRRLSAALVAGLGLSLLGGVLAYAARLGGGLAIGPGALMAFLSVVMFSWGSRQTVAGFPALSALGQTTVTLAGAALLMLALALLRATLAAPGPDWAAFRAGFGPAEAAALALYGIGSLALSQVLWILGVARLGIGIAAMHANAAPFYVMVLMLALGAAWNWWQALGAGLVAAGVLIAQQGRAQALPLPVPGRGPRKGA